MKPIDPKILAEQLMEQTRRFQDWLNSRPPAPVEDQTLSFEEWSQKYGNTAPATWGDGDIRKALATAPEEQWKGMWVAVWTNLGKLATTQESITGTLEKIEGGKYTIQLSDREVCCRDYRIRSLIRLSDIMAALLKAYPKCLLDQLDKSSTSEESFERKRKRLAGEIEHEDARKFIEQATYQPPPNRKNSDPDRGLKVMRELTIAYLEGHTLTPESAHKIAGEKLGLKPYIVRNEYTKWRDSHKK